MTIEVKTQALVRVGVEALWRALAKDLKHVVPIIMPHQVKDVEVLEGDGGMGTVLLFHFTSGVSNMSCQKEMITEYDESLHQIGLQVIEGGYLNLGFSSCKTVTQLTAVAGSETLVDVKVAYEAEAEVVDTTMPTLFFMQCLENYLLSQGCRS